MKPRVQVRTRRQWDRYCLWLAFGGGNLAGIIWILPYLSPALGFLVAWPWDFHRLGDLLLIAVISYLSHVPRRLLWWVPVPSALWLAWSVADRIVLGDWAGVVNDLPGNLFGAGLDTIFGGLVAFFTGKFAQGLDEEDGIPDAVAMPLDLQEGVWPPAPNYPTQPLGQKEDGPHGK